MKSEEKTERKLKYYFICFDCAKSMGAKLGNTICTCHEDTCRYCGEVKTLNAISDWHWPNKESEYIWD